MSNLALQTTVADLVAEYDSKSANVAQAIADYNAATTAIKMASTVMGTFADSIMREPILQERELQKNLLKSGWKAIYSRLNIGSIASAKDKQLFERTIADPPPLTLDNAKATFGDYFIRPRFHILRGLAEVFTSLDPAYKSHSNVRIGVKGLPKRVILNGFFGFSYSNYSHNKFRDIVNALAAYQGKPQLIYDEIRAIEEAQRSGDDYVMSARDYPQLGKDEPTRIPDRGITVRGFANGNAHVFFDKWTLLDINKALAEFYGEVLPDVEYDTPTASTAVAKDLQFYWSPQPVVEAALEFAEIYTRDGYGYGRELPQYRVLEPSCGDGLILDELRARGCKALGFEVDAGRAAQARAKGHAVVTGNFLEQEPTGDFDKVVMNPPFYGRHYIKHVNHALKFLKPGGVLVSILPATAHYDHKELKGEWRDLPVASFADAGTNVPTGMVKIARRA